MPARKYQMVSELTGPAIIGQKYWVPCVFVPGCVGDGPGACWYPIFGPEHSDAELDFEHRHYHIDRRFVPWYLRELFTYGGVAVHPESHCKTSLTGRAENAYRGRPRLRLLKCYGAWDTEEFPAYGIEWNEQRLARHHRPLGSCRTCPHRGFDLRQVEPDERGVITCPGHGLRWWAKDGAPFRSEVHP